MDENVTCIFCGGDVWVSDVARVYYCRCSERACGAYGPDAATEQGAIDAFLAPTRQKATSQTPYHKERQRNKRLVDALVDAREMRDEYRVVAVNQCYKNATLKEQIKQLEVALVRARSVCEPGVTRPQVFDAIYGQIRAENGHGGVTGIEDAVDAIMALLSSEPELKLCPFCGVTKADVFCSCDNCAAIGDK